MCMRRFCAFCISPVLGFAQQNRGADLRTTLDVAVTDKSGKPIEGLRKSDFTPLDNKLPRTIVSFRAIASGTATPHPPVEVVTIVDAVDECPQSSAANGCRRSAAEPGRWREGR